tara:strand:- start:2733 stop:3164 length:432 start_codon:yes stop_codon:yes gene_type:complete
MKLKNKILIVIFFFTISSSLAGENLFENAKKNFEQNNFEEAKFLFQRNLVFEPKDSKSYLYLAKIFKIEENESESEKNIKSALLLDSKNEEAMYMMMDIELNRSNFSRVKELKSDFEKICNSLCDKLTSIQERLENFDTSNES